MSFFRKLTTDIKDEACLKSGLTKLGYKPVSTGSKQQVRGHGNEKLMADVVLRKEDTKLGGDIGFNKQTNGSYELVYDAYVAKINQKEFLTSVSNEYLRAKVRKTQAKMEGYELIQNTEKDGTITMRYRQVAA